mgnify:CR=1 FL=1
MPKLKLSNIVERELYIDSDSFKSLSPKLKDAVKEIFESIKDNTDDIIKTFEGQIKNSFYVFDSIIFNINIKGTFVLKCFVLLFSSYMMYIE